MSLADAVRIYTDVLYLQAGCTSSCAAAQGFTPVPHYPLRLRWVAPPLELFSSQLEPIDAASLLMIFARAPVSCELVYQLWPMRYIIY